MINIKDDVRELWFVQGRKDPFPTAPDLQALPPGDLAKAAAHWCVPNVACHERSLAASRNSACSVPAHHRRECADSVMAAAHQQFSDPVLLCRLEKSLLAWRIASAGPDGSQRRFTLHWSRSAGLSLTGEPRLPPYPCLLSGEVLAARAAPWPGMLGACCSG